MKTFTDFLNLIPGRAKRFSSAEGPQSEKTIGAWLINRLAEKLSLDPEEVDPRESFANYGLDSRAAVGLSGDLERWLQLSLSPTLVWDYPTINAMAEYLAAQCREASQNDVSQTVASSVPIAAEEA